MDFVVIYYSSSVAPRVIYPVFANSDKAFGQQIQGNSSVGRAAVSKTACRGFEPFFPCQPLCEHHGGYTVR